MSGFKWTSKATAVAIGLANGRTQTEVAQEAGMNDRTIRRWLDDPEFSAEVDRLTLMTDIASRAGRLRIAKRAVRQKIADDGVVITKADILEWLKFAQSETDGVKLDLTKLAAALGADDAPVAGGRSD